MLGEKKMKRKFFSFVILFLGLFAFPFVVSAKEPTEKFYMNISLQENGDIKVQELIQLDGNYNGLSRELEYLGKTKTFTGVKEDLEGSSLYNGEAISDVFVSSVDEDDFSFEAMDHISSYFEETSYAVNGDSGVYTLRPAWNGVNLQIYNPSSLHEAFYIEYTVKNVAVVHNDIAELAWNVLGDGYRENIGDFQVRVTLPTSVSDLRMWLHGPLNGEIEPMGENGSLVTYDFLGAYNAVSVRLMFPKEVIPESTKFSGMDAREDILEIEQELADQANLERERIARANLIVTIISIAWYVAAILLTIYACYLSKKSLKTNFAMEYYRDFPADYGPEVLEYLLKQNVTEDSLSACILNLIYKKAIKVEEVVEEKKKKKEYKLILLAENTSSYSEPEQKVIKLLFKDVGNGKEVNLTAFQKYGTAPSQARTFMDTYNSFLRSAKALGKKEKFFKTAPAVVTISVLVSLLGFLISFLAISFDISFFLAPFAGLLGIILVIIVLTKKFYTKKGAEHHGKWMAHKRFLEDFGRMDEKELPEVVLWDKYLVYATVLGCAETLSKQMKIKIDDLYPDTNINPTVMGYNPFLTHYLLYSAVSSSIHQSVHTAVASSRSSIASSQSSSLGGFGGGASMGGGSFGGGGGGGRF